MTWTLARQAHVTQVLGCTHGFLKQSHLSQFRIHCLKVAETNYLPDDLLKARECFQHEYTVNTNKCNGLITTGLRGCGGLVWRRARTMGICVFWCKIYYVHFIMQHIKELPWEPSFRLIVRLNCLLYQIDNRHNSWTLMSKQPLGLLLHSMYFGKLLLFFI